MKNFEEFLKDMNKYPSEDKYTKLYLEGVI